MEYCRLNLNITKMIVDGFGMTTISEALAYVQELSSLEWEITHHKLTVQQYNTCAHDLLQAYRNLESILGEPDKYLCRTR